MKTRLVFVRHGVTEANLSDKFLGLTDVNLSEKGFLQANAVSERLEKEIMFDAVYSSNMKRTIQTAQFISNKNRVSVITSDNLKELNFGDWEGKTHTEVALKYPNEFILWQKKNYLHRNINGESVARLQVRLLKEVNRIVKSNKNKTICIVSHAACIKAMMCYFKGYTLDEMYKISWCDNTGISVVDFMDGKYEILSMSDSSHLNENIKENTYLNLGELIKMAENNSKLYKHSMISVS